MSVMMATRRHLMAAHDHEAEIPAARSREPPPFVVRPRASCNERLTRLFEAHRDELGVSPGSPLLPCAA